MGNKAKVQLVGARVATIDLDATQGSRIGTDLLLPDGTLANATNLKAYLGISTTAPGSQQLMWEAIYNVPANVQQVALLSTAGIVVRVSGTSWLTRTITGTAGLITVTNGSGVSANPTITIPDQNANLVLAGPSTGAAAAPTFRSIVLADLPTISYAYGGTGFTTYAAGDIIYASAANTLAKLAAGTNGHVLTLAAGVPTWAAGGGGGGGGNFTYVNTATVSGSAATTLSMSSLDLGTDEHYEIHFALDNNTASSAVISLFYNADTTPTNYYNVYNSASGVAPTSVRANDATIVFMSASETLTGVIHIEKDRDGKARALMIVNRAQPSGIILQIFAHAWTSATNVTGITLSSSVANTFTVGSYFKVYKVKP